MYISTYLIPMVPYFRQASGGTYLRELRIILSTPYSTIIYNHLQDQQITIRDDDADDLTMILRRDSNRIVGKRCARYYSVHTHANLQNAILVRNPSGSNSRHYRPRFSSPSWSGKGTQYSVYILCIIPCTVRSRVLRIVHQTL